MAARDTLVVRSCAEPDCKVVAELPRGQSVEVLKTEGGWHWVLVTLEGSRATTGWVEAATSAPAPRSAVTGARHDRPREAANSTSAVPPTAVDDPNCLACLATRTATADEWSEALAVTSSMKAPAALAAPDTSSPSRGTTPASPARVDTVRHNGRSSIERMRDDLEERFGGDLKRLSELATKLDPDLQTYITVCYEKYLPIAVLPPGPTPPTPLPSPRRPNATIFDMWRGRPTYAWNQPWSTGAVISADSTAFCQGLWQDVSDRADAIKAGVNQIEADARDADIYPGVVRDALEAYGLGEKR